jgi:hypothetical protein
MKKSDISVVREGFAKWVLDYEKYFIHYSLLYSKLTCNYRFYFKGDPLRASACPVTVHALLHVADCIEWLGPTWAYWMFATERFCSEIPRVAKNRRLPFEAISKHLENSAYLSSTLIRFEIDITKPKKPGQTIGDDNHCKLSLSFVDYQSLLLDPYSVLFPPQDKNAKPGRGIKSLLIGSLAQRFNITDQEVICAHMMEPIEQWGSVEITLGGADTLHTNGMVYKAHDWRDNTFVQVSVQLYIFSLTDSQV